MLMDSQDTAHERTYVVVMHGSTGWRICRVFASSWLAACATAELAAREGTIEDTAPGATYDECICMLTDRPMSEPGLTIELIDAGTGDPPSWATEPSR